MKFRCPYCKAEFGVVPETGKPPAVCPTCGKTMNIPAALRLPEEVWRGESSGVESPRREKATSRRRAARGRRELETRMTGGALPVVLLGQRGLWRVMPLGLSLVCALALFVYKSGLLGPGIERLANANLDRIATRELDNLRVALEFFRADCGRYPTAEEGLRALIQPPGDAGWNGPYVNLIRPDPWGHPYAYDLAHESVRLRSLGPDGQDGTADDLRAASDGRMPALPESSAGAGEAAP